MSKITESEFNDIHVFYTMALEKLRDKASFMPGFNIIADELEACLETYTFKDFETEVLSREVDR